MSRLRAILECCPFAMILAALGCNDPKVALGSITVPENRRDPESKPISLSYRRIGPDRPDRTVLHFNGGPGMSNLKHSYPESLLAELSVVEVGYRGVDSSRRLSCDAIDRALTPDGRWGPTALRGIADAMASCLAGWKRAGIDVRGYQARDVADDIEAVRRHLGLGKVYLMGDSYGTRVALTYQSLYPESVARTILVGANPPGHFFWSASDVSNAFAAYQPYFERARPEYEGRTTLEALCVETLARAPAGVFGVRIDPFRVRATTFILLFHERTSSFAFDAFLRAHERGDYAGLAVMSRLHDVMLMRSFDVWGDFFVKGLVDLEPMRDYVAESASTPQTFGSALGTMLFGPPYAPDLFAFRDAPAPLEVRTPTLILAGNLDFSTPAVNSQRELAERFPSHVTQVTFPDRGHVADFWAEGDAFGAMAAAFLRHGEVPRVTDLPSRPVAFDRRLGLTHVPVVLVSVLVALASALAWAARRIRRRRAMRASATAVQPPGGSAHAPVNQPVGKA